MAAAYRSLRKNREDSKDEPGGADFYYGEMEMRRLVAAPLSAEGCLLAVYWLFSGYALRASRAVATLLGVLLVGGVLLDRFGYATETDASPVDAILLLAQVALALTRTPSGLNESGTLIVIAARILCPALIALAVLALRGRVKR